MAGMMIKRDVRALGRTRNAFRKIKLLSSGADGAIDPSRWIQTQGAKQFDDKNTAILRVYRHKTEERFLVHGVRSQRADGDKTAKVVAEAHEMVALAEAVPAVVAQVAKACGVEPLIEKLA